MIYVRRLEFKDFSRSVHITRECRLVFGICYGSAWEEQWVFENSEHLESPDSAMWCCFVSWQAQRYSTFRYSDYCGDPTALHPAISLISQLHSTSCSFSSVPTICDHPAAHTVGTSQWLSYVTYCDSRRWSGWHREYVDRNWRDMLISCFRTLQEKT